MFGCQQSSVMLLLYRQLLTTFAGVISSASDLIAYISIDTHCPKIQCSIFPAMYMLALDLY